MLKSRSVIVAIDFGATKAHFDMTKEIRLNAFAMNCVAHQSPGLWTHPHDRTAD